MSGDRDGNNLGQLIEKYSKEYEVDAANIDEAKDDASSIVAALLKLSEMQAPLIQTRLTYIQTLQTNYADNTRVIKDLLDKQVNTTNRIYVLLALMHKIAQAELALTERESFHSAHDDQDAGNRASVASFATAQEIDETSEGIDFRSLGLEEYQINALALLHAEISKYIEDLKISPDELLTGYLQDGKDLQLRYIALINSFPDIIQEDPVLVALSDQLQTAIDGVKDKLAADARASVASFVTAEGSDSDIQNVGAQEHDEISQILILLKNSLDDILKSVPAVTIKPSTIGKTLEERTTADYDFVNQSTANQQNKEYNKQVLDRMTAITTMSPEEGLSNVKRINKFLDLCVKLSRALWTRYEENQTIKDFLALAIDILNSTSDQDIHDKLLILDREYYKLISSPEKIPQEALDSLTLLHDGMIDVYKLREEYLKHLSLAITASIWSVNQYLQQEDHNNDSTESYTNNLNDLRAIISVYEKLKIGELPFDLLIMSIECYSLIRMLEAVRNNTQPKGVYDEYISKGNDIIKKFADLQARVDALLKQKEPSELLAQTLLTETNLAVANIDKYIQQLNNFSKAHNLEIPKEIAKQIAALQKYKTRLKKANKKLVKILAKQNLQSVMTARTADDPRHPASAVITSTPSSSPVTITREQKALYSAVIKQGAALNKILPANNDITLVSNHAEFIVKLQAKIQDLIEKIKLIQPQLDLTTQVLAEIEKKPFDDANVFQFIINNASNFTPPLGDALLTILQASIVQDRLQKAIDAQEALAASERTTLKQTETHTEQSDEAKQFAEIITISDIEGRFELLQKQVDGSNGRMSFAYDKDGNIYIKFANPKDIQLVINGDMFDHGPDAIYLWQIIANTIEVYAKTNPDIIKILLGNRELNKVRFAQELNTTHILAEYKRAKTSTKQQDALPYWAGGDKFYAWLKKENSSFVARLDAETPESVKTNMGYVQALEVYYLKWMLSQTMGSGKSDVFESDFEYRRFELMLRKQLGNVLRLTPDKLAEAKIKLMLETFGLAEGIWQALNLRANNFADQKVMLMLVKKYGLEKFKAKFNQELDAATAAINAIKAEIPGLRRQYFDLDQNYVLDGIAAYNGKYKVTDYEVYQSFQKAAGLDVKEVDHPAFYAEALQQGSLVYINNGQIWFHGGINTASFQVPHFKTDGTLEFIDFKTLIDAETTLAGKQKQLAAWAAALNAAYKYALAHQDNEDCQDFLMSLSIENSNSKKAGNKFDGKSAIIAVLMKADGSLHPTVEDAFKTLGDCGITTVNVGHKPYGSSPIAISVTIAGLQLNVTDTTYGGGSACYLVTERDGTTYKVLLDKRFSKEPLKITSEYPAMRMQFDADRLILEARVGANSNVMVGNRELLLMVLALIAPDPKVDALKEDVLKGYRDKLEQFFYPDPNKETISEQEARDIINKVNEIMKDRPINASDAIELNAKTGTMPFQILQFRTDTAGFKANGFGLPNGVLAQMVKDGVLVDAKTGAAPNIEIPPTTVTNLTSVIYAIMEDLFKDKEQNADVIRRMILAFNDFDFGSQTIPDQLSLLKMMQGVLLDAQNPQNYTELLDKIFNYQARVINLLTDDIKKVLREFDIGSSMSVFFNPANRKPESIQSEIDTLLAKAQDLLANLESIVENIKEDSLIENSPYKLLIKKIHKLRSMLDEYDQKPAKELKTGVDYITATVLGEFNKLLQLIGQVILAANNLHQFMPETPTAADPTLTNISRLLASANTSFKQAQAWANTRLSGSFNATKAKTSLESLTEKSDNIYNELRQLVASDAISIVTIPFTFKLMPDTEEEQSLIKTLLIKYSEIKDDETQLIALKETLMSTQNHVGREFKAAIQFLIDARILAIQLQKRIDIANAPRTPSRMPTMRDMAANVSGAMGSVTGRMRSGTSTSTSGDEESPPAASATKQKTTRMPTIGGMAASVGGAMSAMASRMPIRKKEQARSAKQSDLGVANPLFDPTSTSKTGFLGGFSKFLHTEKDKHSTQSEDETPASAVPTTDEDDAQTASVACGLDFKDPTASSMMATMSGMAHAARTAAGNTYTAAGEKRKELTATASSTLASMAAGAASIMPSKKGKAKTTLEKLHGAFTEVCARDTYKDDSDAPMYVVTDIQTSTFAVQRANPNTALDEEKDMIEVHTNTDRGNEHIAVDGSVEAWTIALLALKQYGTNQTINNISMGKEGEGAFTPAEKAANFVTALALVSADPKMETTLQRTGLPLTANATNFVLDVLATGNTDENKQTVRDLFGLALVSEGILMSSATSAQTTKAAKGTLLGASFKTTKKGGLTTTISPQALETWKKRPPAPPPKPKDGGNGTKRFSVDV